jgi:hypothetical protein
MRAPKDFLILWQNKEASGWTGRIPKSTAGTHSKGLVPGDKAFIISYDNKDLYLSGCMEIKEVDHDHAPPVAYGPSIAGKFQYIPLRKQ